MTAAVSDGALLATVTDADDTAVPASVPSDGVAATDTTSPRSKYAPVRVADVGATATPLTVHA